MKLSIIIPAYNLEKYIKRNIDSILNQLTNDVEVIIVDDGSTDNTLKVVKECIKNTRIELIIKKNGGVSSARNAGLKKALGEYVLFLDGDDYLEKDAVLNIIKTINSNNSDVYIFNYQNVNSNYEVSNNYNKISISKDFEIKDKNHLFDFLFIHKKVSVWTGCIVISTNICKNRNIYFKDEFTNAEDLNFYYKVLFNCKKIFCSPFSISNYYERENSISNQFSVNKMSAFKAIKEIGQGLPISLDNSIKKFFEYDLAYTTYMYNFVKCTNSMRGIKKRKSIRYLKREIDDKFPEFSMQMKLKNIKNFQFKKNKLKWLIFKLSPYLYIKLFDIYEIN